jgi:hypothetical protein
MPSDLKAAATSDAAGAQVRAPQAEGATAQTVVVEPPSVKLVVRLFLIPLLIVAAAVGVMFLIGALAGGTPSFEEAMARLKNPGGERTADVFVGPGAKQRYMDAMTLTEKMKSGMNEAERIAITSDLIDVLDKHAKPEEGKVQHFLILALGRVWQLDPSQPAMDSDAALESRRQAMATLLKYAQSELVASRKAAMLALAYWAGRAETKEALPLAIAKLRDSREDLDVRIAAATVLGPLGSPDNNEIIDALENAMRDTDPRNVELVWSAALSLAQLNQPQVADTILMLLDRKELAELQYYDRETDALNPSLRKLSDQEQQRILINTMLGARHLKVPEVQAKLKELAETDPSPRVRAAGKEILNARMEDGG